MVFYNAINNIWNLIVGFIDNVAEWSKAPALGAGLARGVGSNPTVVINLCLLFTKRGRKQTNERDVKRGAAIQSVTGIKNP